MLGSTAAALGRIDALVFKAGIGEHAAEIRRLICSLGSGLPPFSLAISLGCFAGLILDLCRVLAANPYEPEPCSNTPRFVPSIRRRTINSDEVFGTHRTYRLK